VYCLCLRMIGNTAEAEELTQEVFLLLFRKIHTFRGASAFSTWLHRLSVNIVLMRLRKKKLDETPLEDSTREEFDEPLRQFGAPDLGLKGLIDRVHDVLGYEHNEIAAILRCSIGNSKSQLHKARMRLRKLLQQTTREEAHQKELRLDP
jgi:RNA polymerase sigma-70 factor (ECF subfamily)